MTGQLPLSGKTIVVTRRKEQAKEFSELLEQQGAAVILFPAVEIAEPSSWNECDTALERLSEYSGIIFTSTNAAEYFFRRGTERRKSDRVSCRLYAVGDKTKEKIELNSDVSATDLFEYPDTPPIKKTMKAIIIL